MDKMNKYRALVEKLLFEEVEMVKRDEEHDQYMAVRHGWAGKRRIHSPIVYIRFQNGKIWIEEDWTEDGFANKLVAHDVPVTDIVLGFRHPSARPFTEFAVA